MKAAEKIYNAKYYQKHKAKILARAKERAGNIADAVGDRLGGKERREAEEAVDKTNKTVDELRKEGKSDSDIKNDERYVDSLRKAQHLASTYYRTPMGKAEKASIIGKNKIKALQFDINKAKSGVKITSNRTKKKKKKSSVKSTVSSIANKAVSKASSTAEKVKNRVK